MFNRFFIALREYGFGSQRAVPSLDGLRAISIAFVFVAHLAGTRHFPFSLSSTYKLGEFGVRIFLVISGYLITSILLAELQRERTISLSRFYFRRTLRLFPASYFLIVVVAILAAKHLVALARWDLTFAITYTMNYYDARAWPLAHLWSLAVEEQFYLLWPFTLRMLGAKRSVGFLIGVLALAPLLRLLSPYVGPAFNFLIWSDALATGCLLAILKDRLSASTSYARLLASRWFMLVPMAALAADYVPLTKISWLACVTIMNLAIAVTIDWTIRMPHTAVARFLNWPAMSFVGVLSYSLYLWQQLFLNRASTSPYCAFPLNVILAVSMALFSYVLIEVPFLRFRALFEDAHAQRIRIRAACD